MKPNNTKEAGGANQMMLSEVKFLKERVKVLEADNKLLRSREVSQTAPVITQQEFNRVRNALLNLLVAVENKFGISLVGKQPNPGKELEEATKAAEAIIRPLTAKDIPQGDASEFQRPTVVINVDRAE